MSKNRLPAYPALANELRSASLGINPAELQGLLTGMLSGGLSLNDKSWQALVFDYTNDGMGWPIGALASAEQILLAMWIPILSFHYSYLKARARKPCLSSRMRLRNGLTTLFLD